MRVNIETLVAGSVIHLSTNHIRKYEPKLLQSPFFQIFSQFFLYLGYQDTCDGNIQLLSFEILMPFSYEIKQGNCIFILGSVTFWSKGCINSMNCCVSYSILIWYSYHLYRIMNDSYFKTLLRIKLFQKKDTHNLSYFLSFLV